MDHSHNKPKDKAKDEAQKIEDHLKERTLHVHDKAIPKKEKVGNRPAHHHKHHPHKEQGGQEGHEMHGEHDMHGG